MAWQIQRKICLPKLQVIVAAGDSFPVSFDGLSLFQMSWFSCPSLCSCVFFSSTGWVHKSSQSQFYFRAKSTSNCVSELTSIQVLCCSLLLESPCFFRSPKGSTGARYLFVDEAAGLPVAEATQLLRTGKRVILATTLDGGWAKFRKTTGPTGRPGTMKALWPMAQLFHYIIHGIGSLYNIYIYL